MYSKSSHDHRVLKNKSNDSYYNRFLDNDKPLWYRLLWALTIIMSCCICVYQIVDRFSFYLADPTSTNIVVVRNATIKYPSFTICLSSHYIPELDHHRQKLHEILQEDVFLCSQKYQKLIDQGILTDFTALWSYLDVRQLNIQKAFYSSAAKQHVEVNITEKTVRTNFGDCVTYTIPKMLLFVGYESILEIKFPITDDLCDNYPMAASILVHDDFVDPKYKVQFFSEGLHKNRSYFLQIAPKHFHNLNLQRDPCTEADVYEECNRKCLERFFKQKLTCKLPSTAFLQVADCKNNEARESSISIMIDVMTETDPKRDCGCKRMCTENLYSIELQYLDKITGYTTVYPRFTSNTFEVITEKRVYTFVSFISDAGGNCGLFLGVCVLSILDTLETILSYLKSRMHEK